MKHTYNVTGMTCTNCIASVESALNAVDAVQNAIVDLDKGEVTITMTSHISAETLKKALPEKYTLSEKKEQNVFKSSKASEGKSKIKQLFPLFLIFAYLVAATILLHNEDRNVAEAMLDFMGLFYFVFSFFKFLDLKGFAASFQMYDPLASQFSLYGIIYPFIELGLGIMLLARFEVEIALALTIIFLGLTTVGVVKTLLSKKKIQCACLGTTLNLPMTEATFIENAIMIGMALLMILGIF
ncbi:heavy-metal-associated domain-containing protein [Jejudonia soesokkakensis]|uniref:Heavy-metal-associated domain-containing protein n=1 Tax=Jejudonia soesokkakensis TaxID=1323432 RepID=A0ABW2MS08_9FLAO